MKTPCKKQSPNPSPAADIIFRVVLVGTYKGDQLKNWPGWYCRPPDAGSRYAHAHLEKMQEAA